MAEQVSEQPRRQTYASAFVEREGNYRADEEGVYGKLGRAIVALRDADNTIARLDSELSAALVDVAEAKEDVALCEELRDQDSKGHEYLREMLQRAESTIDTLREANVRLEGKAAKPIPMVLCCPQCTARHIDEGEFENKPHHTHACQTCGFVWRPAIVPTVGVQFLPGFQNVRPLSGGVEELAEWIAPAPTIPPGAGPEATDRFACPNCGEMLTHWSGHQVKGMDLEGYRCKRADDAVHANRIPPTPPVAQSSEPEPTYGRETCQSCHAVERLTPTQARFDHRPDKRQSELCDCDCHLMLWWYRGEEEGGDAQCQSRQQSVRPMSNDAGLDIPPSSPQAIESPECPCCPDGCRDPHNYQGSEVCQKHRVPLCYRVHRDRALKKIEKADQYRRNALDELNDACRMIGDRDIEIRKASDRIRSLEAQLAVAKFSPLGDNHHNAAQCPYCAPQRRSL